MHTHMHAALENNTRNLLFDNSGTASHMYWTLRCIKQCKKSNTLATEHLMGINQCASPPPKLPMGLPGIPPGRNSCQQSGIDFLQRRGNGRYDGYRSGRRHEHGHDDRPRRHFSYGRAANNISVDSWILPWAPLCTPWSPAWKQPCKRP